MTTMEEMKSQDKYSALLRCSNAVKFSFLPETKTILLTTELPRSLLLRFASPVFEKLHKPPEQSECLSRSRNLSNSFPPKIIVGRDKTCEMSPK